MKIHVLIDGTTYEVDLWETEEDSPSLPASLASPVRATIQSAVVPTAAKEASPSDGEDCLDGSKVCRSPVAGLVIRVHAQSGDELQAGDLIIVLEAMKMETKVSAPFAGKLKSVKVLPGDAVKLDQILADFL